MPAEEHLRIDVRHEGNRLVLRLAGELDLATVSLLEGQIDEAGAQDAAMVVLDLEQLDFIDSTGLRAVLSAHATAVEREQEFAVTRGSEQVQRLLSLTHVAEHLRIVEPSADRDSS
ncbi:MAG TPA: STAS domain-containing protein [Solirubrobacteraceae bacterium]